ncbi:hypothetical protein [Flavobacterium ardleyense]|uniref:hypothetical protein n=1 Tax=Flavobacterium ardleyense TaxID=2038737 RepID=UPI00298D14C8|nr:hypothetical protein [Flavobacterium ardleyense]
MKKVLLVAIGSMFIYSCNNKKEDIAVDPNSEVEVKMMDEHLDQDANSAIMMNNGQRWLVNAEMKPFVMKGEQLVNDYTQNKGTDYKMLAEELKSQNNQLIKSCTMDGKSHDELHKWLHPHLKLTEKLEKATDAAMADATVLELQNSYKQYHQYFN